jgi:K+-sensing histidine kinase KdpD
MTGERKILVLLDPQSSELSALHHALALAERLSARLIILRIEPLKGKTALSGWMDDALFEILNRARETGLAVSCNTLRDGSGEAVLGFVQEQGIDVLVVGEHERHWEKDVLRMNSRMPTQIIRVEEKSELSARAGKRRG